MVKGTTSTGFKFSVDQKKVKDYRFLKIAAQAQNNPLLTPEVIQFLLGEDGEQKLMEHVETKGFVDTEKVAAEFEEILKTLNESEETKN